MKGKEIARALVISFLTLFTILDSASGQEPNQKQKIGDEEAGKAIYVQKCAMCHGEKGDGKGKVAVAFNPKPTNFLVMTDTTSAEYLLTIITNGKKNMPAFENMLTKQQRLDVTTYILNFKQRSRKQK